MNNSMIDIKIIDRTEEERNRDYEVACAEGLGISVEELRDSVQEIKDFEDKRKEMEGIMILEWCHTVLVGRILMLCDVERLMRYL